MAVYYYGDFVTVINSISIDIDGFEFIIYPGEKLKVIEGADNNDDTIYVEYSEYNCTPICIYIDINNITRY